MQARRLCVRVGGGGGGGGITGVQTPHMAPFFSACVLVCNMLRYPNVSNCQPIKNVVQLQKSKHLHDITKVGLVFSIKGPIIEHFRKYQMLHCSGRSLIRQLQTTYLRRSINGMICIKIVFYNPPPPPPTERRKK